VSSKTFNLFYFASFAKEKRKKYLKNDNNKQTPPPELNLKLKFENDSLAIS